MVSFGRARLTRPSPKPVIIAASLMIIASACGKIHPEGFAVPQASPGVDGVQTTYPSVTETTFPLLAFDSDPQLISDPEPIGLDNIDRLVEAAHLGKGAIQFEPIWAREGMPIYSPDGLWMAIPSAAGIYLYDARTLEEQYRIPVGTTFITFSPDAALLAAGGQGLVSLWEVSTGEGVGKLQGGYEEAYWELTFSPEGSMLAAASSKRQITLWAVNCGERRFTLPGDRLRFSLDGRFAVTVVYGEDQVFLYETAGGALVNLWKAHDAGFTPDDMLWLEADGIVRLVDLDRDLLSAPFYGSQPSFVRDMMVLFNNKQIWLYDHHKGRQERMLEGRYERVDGLLFSPLGQTLAGEVYNLICPSCSELDGLDRKLIVWQASNGETLWTIEHPYGWLAYSVDGQFIAVQQGETVRVVRAFDGTLVKAIEGFSAPIAGMAVSPDGLTLAAVHATEPYTLRLWDLADREVIGVLQSTAAPNLTRVDVHFSPDGSTLAIGGDLWDLSTGSHYAEMERAIGERTSCWPINVAFSPTSDVLATGCFEGQLDQWSLLEGVHLHRLGSFEGWVNGLAYSPDGSYLAAIYDEPEEMVLTWQLPEGAFAFSVTGGPFRRVTFSPTEGLLATISAKVEYDQYGWPAGTVQLWLVPNAVELAQLPQDDAVSLAFSPDGRILATGSLYGILRLWDVSGLQLLLEVKAHQEQIQGLTFSPDGTQLIAGSQDGTISLWGVAVSP